MIISFSFFSSSLRVLILSCFLALSESCISSRTKVIKIVDNSPFQKLMGRIDISFAGHWFLGLFGLSLVLICRRATCDVAAADTTPTYEDITPTAQETSEVFNAGMPAKSNSSQLLRHAGGKDWHGLCVRVAGDFCSHIGTVSQAVPVGSLVGVMSQVARRHKALPIISNARPRNPCAKSLYPFPSQFKVGSLQASLQVLNSFVYIVRYGLVVWIEPRK